MSKNTKSLLMLAGIMTTIHPEGNINACTKFHHNPSNSCKSQEIMYNIYQISRQSIHPIDISVWTKLEDPSAIHTANVAKKATVTTLNELRKLTKGSRGDNNCFPQVKERVYGDTLPSNQIQYNSSPVSSSCLCILQKEEIQS